MERQLWQKPWHRNLSSKGSVDSLGIIRINAETWNKEMSHHNTDQLFISILCFTRWISWVIMDRRGCRSLLFVMTDMCALFLCAPVGRTMSGGRREQKINARKPKQTHMSNREGMLSFIYCWPYLNIGCKPNYWSYQEQTLLTWAHGALCSLCTTV